MAKGRGRPRGSRNRKAKETKAEQVEVNRASELALPDPIQLDDEDFDFHLKSLKGANDRMKQAKNLYDGCCKAAKKVAPELLDAVKLAIKYEGKSQDDIKKMLEIQGYVLKRTESAVQLTVHNMLLGDVMEQATKRGYDDAKAGQGSRNRYPVGTELHTAYIEGFSQGTAEMVGGVPEGTNTGDPLPLSDDDVQPREEVEEAAE